MEPSDPEWLLLRKQHQQELYACLVRKENALQDLQRRANAEQAELLAEHAQQERNFWSRYEMRASATAYPIAHRAGLAATQCVAAPAGAPSANQGTLPTPKLTAAKTSSAKVNVSQTLSGKATPTISARQRHAEQPPKHPRFQHAQPASKKESKSSTNGAQPPNVGKSKPQKTARQGKEAAGREPVIINLCTSDDEMLVEVQKAAFKEKTAATKAAQPSRPGIPVATFQFFGQDSPPFPGPPSAYREAREVTRPGPSEHWQRIPQPTHTGIEKYPQEVQLVELRNINQTQGDTASSASRSTVFQAGATSNQPNRHHQSAPRSIIATAASLKNNLIGYLSNNLHSQVQETSVFSKNGAADTVTRFHALLQQGQRNDSITSHGLYKGQVDQHSSAPNCVLAEKDGLEDKHVENAPLASLNNGLEFKQLGATIPKDTNLNADLSTPIVTKSSVSPYLPSPSPSLASLPHAVTTHEATVLLNSPKKLGLPLASSCPPEGAGPIADSRASSCTVGQDPVPALTIPISRQVCVASRMSKVPALSRKRKVVNLSDDEQHEYSSSRAATAGNKLSTNSLSSPSKKVTEEKRKTSDSGFRRNPTPAARCALVNPPHTPITISEPTAPVKPTQSFRNVQNEVLPPPSSKRRAAIHAQSKIQDISEADALFHTEDEVFQATGRESRQNGASTADLGMRLGSMSIIPVPMNTRFGVRRDETAFEAPGLRGHTSGAARNKDDVRTKEKVPRCRTTQHRRAPRTRNIDKIIGGDSDNDEDGMKNLDISKFTYIDGIIVEAGQEERLTEEQTKALRRREL
ncbi:hypothetical protein SVAN01_02274 [Stagonosporopsis vannaccii]|nr:hypothetical protein SVAN01_02274 [Stagonosporopsis vannaccii]